MAAQAMHRAEAESKARREKAGKAYRFWLKAGNDANITFLDGRIDPNTGILDIPYANEHRVKVGNDFEDIVCIEDQEPCPLCAAGEKRAFVGYLSILDHRPREYEKDGKKITLEHTRRLFVAKTETLRQLTKMAEKRDNSLAGVTFEVSRTGDKKAAVGDLFDEVARHSVEDVLAHFGEDGKPLDYEKELTYRSAEEMKAAGIGKTVATIGSGTFGPSGFGGKSAVGVSADAVDDNKAPW